MSYTFKDDGAALTYYREYNKEVGTGDKTLVGNWVEERALRDTISTGRYKLWVDTTSDGRAHQTTYTKFTTRPDSLDTYQRTLVHSDHTPSTEYCTTPNVPDPGYAVYVNPSKGSRTALLEARAKELAAYSEPAEPVLPPQYQTTHRQDYLPKDLPSVDTMGRRVMMTQNGADIKGAGDFLWRKEGGVVHRHLVEEGGGAGPEQTFTMHGMKPARAFGKNTSFSQPIYEYQKGQEKD